jgi:hypothetical protein
MKMLSVKFKSPIVIDEKNLGALLSLAGVAAEVEPYVDGAKVRKPRAVAAPAPEPTSEPEPQASTPVAEPVKEKAKPGRKSNAQKAAEAAAAAAAAASEDVGGETDTTQVEDSDGGEEVDAGTLLNRFSGLIDQDFEAAKDLLDNFGVAKFSDLPESEFLAFSQKLSELYA